MSELLKIIEDHVASGLVSPGPQGEFFGRLILMLAMNHACKQLGKDKRFSLQYVRPVTVRQFLKSLMNEADMKNALSGQVSKEDEDDLLDGIMFAHKFIQIDYEMKKSDLAGFLAMGAAISLRVGTGT